MSKTATAITGHASPPDVESRLKALIRHLYVDLGEGMGGPLHVQLDDYNLADEFLHVGAEQYTYLHDGAWARYAQAGDDTSPQRRDDIELTCRRIVELLLLIPTEAERRRIASASYREIGD